MNTYPLCALIKENDFYRFVCPYPFLKWVPIYMSLRIGTWNFYKSINESEIETLPWEGSVNWINTYSIMRWQNFINRKKEMFSKQLDYMHNFPTQILLFTTNVYLWGRKLIESSEKIARNSFSVRFSRIQNQDK